ncbi:Alkylglycerol monooxygenase [Hypsibius exemplaris]|uniref:Alkylglycerol monooxygenase n=1 Tax=Hypsibius exemplaris TaxID=2072580 RepID=A0A1W0XDZ3_HYPEX|nr:Alkylglycerol monooxygenase [Hypsibius exemplaris]
MTVNLSESHDRSSFFSTDKFDLFHLRALFYLVGPNDVQSDTVGRNASQIPDYFIDTIPVFMVLCLVEFVISFLITGRLFRLNDTLTSWSAGILAHMAKLCVRSLDIGIYTWLFTHYRLGTFSMDSWWSWIGAILFTDLGYYWFHRASHEINLFWAAHQVHHSSEEFNLSVALRQSVVSHLGAWVFYLPMAVVGFTPVTFLVHHQFNLLYQFWIHTSLIKNLGPLEWVLNTPSHHRAHHGRNPLYIDINYGGVFIIWDRLFGTFQVEDPAEPAYYGLVGKLQSHNALYVQIVRLKEIWRRIGTHTNLPDKISAALKGPRWRPGLPFFGLLQRHIPLRDKEKNPEVMYNPSIPVWMMVYATLHFSAVLPYFFAMLARYEHEGSWTVTQVAITFAHVGLSLSFVGSVLDKRWWIPAAETLRCGALSALFTSLPGFSAGEQDPMLVHAMLALFVASMCFWPIYALSQAKRKVT